MRPITQNDISWMIERYRNRGANSYVVLSSIHGYSESELRAALSDASPIQVTDPAESGGLLLSVHDIDAVPGQARIQLCAEQSSSELAGFLRSMMETHGIRRLYSYVFPHEHHEIGILTALGFVKEAVFREHIFFAGAYSDIVVYGLLEMPR